MATGSTAFAIVHPGAHDHASEAEQTIARAAAVLGDGIARYRKAIDSAAGATPPLPAAMLALAQLQMAEGRPAEAIALLQDPGIAATDAGDLTVLAYVAETGQLDKAKLCLQTLQGSLPPPGTADALRGKPCGPAWASVVS